MVEVVLDPAKIRYFVAKCINIASLKKCIETCVWACKDKTLSTDIQPMLLLSQAMDEGKVVLLFSINNCHGWHGYCEMIDKPGSYQSESTETDTAILGKSGETTLWHHFRVSWKCYFLGEFGEQCVPFSSTEFMLPDMTQVNTSRNWQEIPSNIGEKMCRLVDVMYSDLTQKRQNKLNEKFSKRPAPFIDSDESDVTSTQEYWQSVVKKVESELGTVHLACPFGSQRYNLSQAGSDIDVFIVYQAKTNQLLGFNPPKQTIKNSDREKCDYTILELLRYCELLCGGDPRCVETLYLHDDTIIHSSPQWRSLSHLAPLTLTRQCLDKYLRDAQGSNGVKKLQKWKTENPGADVLQAKMSKLSYIVIRLLQNARDVSRRECIRVFRADASEERSVLMSVRRGQYSPSQVADVILRLQEEIDANRDNLPTDSPSTLPVEKWLLQQRFSDFSQNHPS